VDAASLAEDISPAGARAEGQSETSIADAGRYVAEDWNDSTGTVSPCPSPMAEEEMIGFGFSADGGNTFTDLGGLPNPRCHTDGDILLQSFHLGTLRPVQPVPVTLDQPHHGGLSMFPALRLAASDGRLDLSWHSRQNVTTANTSVVAAIGVSPRIATTPPNVPITSAASNWATSGSSLIIPNFGDYTDNTIAVTGARPYAANTLYIAWTDGRLGIPQPFEAHLPAR
jgi:hypothetical protein